MIHLLPTQATFRIRITYHILFSLSLSLYIYIYIYIYMSKPINPVAGKMMGGTFDMTPDLRQARRPSFLNTLTMDHEGRSLPEGKYDSNGSPEDRLKMLF